mgnify:CR=1 FL=1
MSSESCTIVNATSLDADDLNLVAIRPIPPLFWLLNSESLVRLPKPSEVTTSKSASWSRGTISHPTMSVISLK